jgi:photosynthetic reaction center cytochrome c subunit
MSIRTPAMRGALLSLAVLMTASCERPPIESQQTDFRGLGKVHIVNPRLLRERVAAAVPPTVAPAAAPSTVLARDVYQNVQVLGDVDVNEFTRLMLAITQWVSPQQGCEYCHVGDLAADSPYTKVVSRQMLAMTRYINSVGGQQHVGETGVTCWTCHRGQNVPPETWTRAVPGGRQAGIVGGQGGQNIAAASVNYSSLPYDPFTPFLMGNESVRIQSRTDAPWENRTSIKQTEWVYSFMTHISQSLGVNCTYCHNSRSFFPWEGSSPARVTAWHGINLARDLNVEYVMPLADVLPADRKGPMGDVLKINCATCHGGAFKPGYGAQMASFYPSLWQHTGAPPVDGPPAPAEPLPGDGLQDQLEPDRLPGVGPESLPGPPGPVTPPASGSRPRR